MIARKIGQDTLLPSLQLAVEDPNSSSSNCGEGYSCSYTNSISWVELPTPGRGTVPRTSPLPMELNPQVVFERLFGSGATPELRAQRMKQSRSILDALDQGARIAARSARRGRTCARSTSTPKRSARSSAASSWPRRRRTTCPTLDLPPGIPEQFDEHIRLHYELLALAFKADITRVATLLGARDLTSRAYPFPKSPLFPEGGTSVSFHGGSHHQDDPVQVRRYAQLNRYHVSTLAYLAEELKSIPDGDGNLLDRSLIMYGTNMGNSNQHQHYDVPHILVGGANGQLKGNRHLAYERKTVPTGNLLLSVLDMYGIDAGEAGRQHRPTAEAGVARPCARGLSASPTS